MKSHANYLKVKRALGAKRVLLQNDYLEILGDSFQFFNFQYHANVCHLGITKNFKTLINDKYNNNNNK